MLNTHTQTRPMLSQAASAFIYYKHRCLLAANGLIHFRSGDRSDRSRYRSLLTHCALSDTQDVDRAVASARKALEGLWSKMTGIERGKLISRFANRLEELAEELAAIEAIDCGRAITYARHVAVRWIQAVWMGTGAGTGGTSYFHRGEIDLCCTLSG